MRFRLPEKAVQTHIVDALQKVGADVRVLGRPGQRDKRCPKCHAVVRVEQGTRQTPGIPDVLAFLPPSTTGTAAHQLWVEVKAEGGRLSPDQKTFRASCEATGQAHLVGGLDVVLAYLTARGYVKEYPGMYRKESHGSQTRRPDIRRQL